MSRPDPLIDTLFDGRYRILRKLGAGGMASVYLAEDEDLGRQVAIKILDERFAQDDTFLERFRREAESAASLSHPNIVSIYDRGEVENHPYIAMELIEGRSLKDVIRTVGPLPVAKAVAYTQQILSALRFAHRNGIIHRDIKPHNILVGAEERLTVTDFGIARAGASQMTEVGSIMGTAQYLSPEQARGGTVTAASDTYSVGVVLYEMLTGRLPFDGDTPVEIAMKHLNDPPKPPSEVVAGIPEELDLIVLRALSKKPADRYTSADDFSEELAHVGSGLPVSARTSEAATAVLAGAAVGAAAASRTATSAPTRVVDSPTTPPRRPPPPAKPVGYGYRPPPRPPRRRSVFPWLLVIALVAAGAIAGFYVWTQIQRELEETQPVGVPLVIGLEQDLAVQNLEDLGFAVEILTEASSDVPEREVMAQDPEAGTRLDEGDTVTIVVSSGVETVTVPRLQGLQFEEAQARLEELGLVAVRRNVFSDTRPPGEVSSQDPKPGEVLPLGTEIIVRVSKGRQTVEVPDVIGLTQDEAEQVLFDAGFEVNVVGGPSGAPIGTVFEQAPEPGADAASGGTVQISISEGPDVVAVPDVLGADAQSAQNALQASGFGVAVQQIETSDPAQVGIVLAQNPGAGAETETGSTVTIAIGVFVEAPPEPPPEPAPPPEPPPAPPPEPPPAPPPEPPPPPPEEPPPAPEEQPAPEGEGQ